MRNALACVLVLLWTGETWAQAAARDVRGEAEALNYVAYGYHLTALAIRERTGDKEGLAYSFNNLGNVHRNMREYDKALARHQQGLALKIELGLDRVHTLKGMLPIYAWCKKIRDDQGYWTQVEAYVASRNGE